MEIEEEQSFSRAAAAPATSASSSSAGGEEPALFVAVGRDNKESKSALVWALLSMRPYKKIVLTHVHCPAQKVPMPLGGWFEASRLSKEELRAFRLEEKTKMNEILDAYLGICKAHKVQAEILTAEAEDITTGLLNLISQNGITRLVMGASAFSRTKKAPKSKTASAMLQQAEPSCNIWFVFKDGHVSTRDSILLNGITAQLPTNIMASPSVMSTRSEPSPSRSSQEGLAANPLYQIFRRKPKSTVSASPRGETTSLNWESVPPSPLFSCTSSKSSGDDGASYSGSSLTPKDEDIVNGATTVHSAHESADDPLLSLPPNNQDSMAVDNDLFDRLQQAMTEAANSKEEAYEESVKRRFAEKELLLLTRRVGLLERNLKKESNIRGEIEEKYNREKAEFENIRKELDEVSRELHVTCQQKLELDANIEGLEMKLSQAENLLISLQKERDLLQEERNSLQQKLDATACEVEALQSRRMEIGSNLLVALHLSEFSHLELVEATNNFGDALRIGEGGFGTVYKGSLRQTTVAIKKLHPQSMQGHSEYHNEVAILSRFRHPNLVTLIGACEDAYALIYEFLPCGSLEDRLACKDNSPPLSWQARLRISAEICSALMFLHSARPQSVVHGDLKPANILLDANLVSKLSDFGLGRLLTRSSASSTFCRHTDPKGTFCYLDPSFASNGELTPSSDVYSFGVIILQLLTARPPFLVVRDVHFALENNRLQEILDKSAGDWPYVQAQQLAHLGLRCCAVDGKSRPDLVNEVWRILEAMKKAAIGPLSYFGKVEEHQNIPPYFICPIFQEIMSDPHVAADGYTYEAEAIRGWLQSGHATSPMTNLKLENENLTPNHALRSAIQEWLQGRHT